ncbi:MAG: hypothetical protein CMH52_02130 [Myxococcales bacterium]|nr:hypothetical protein [Myxococcales bacterium]
MRIFWIISIVAGLALLFASQITKTPDGEKKHERLVKKVEPSTPLAPPAPPPPPPDPLRPQPDLPEKKRMTVFIKGEERLVERRAAIEAGFIEIELGDDWTPVIFEERNGPDGRFQFNRYRKTFLDLADDRTDGNGRPLKRKERNYLEVFGIPPSMKIVRDRFLKDDQSTCLKNIDYDLISSLDNLTYRRERKENRHLGQMRRYRKQFKKLMKKAKVDSLIDFKPKTKELKRKRKKLLAHQKEMRVLAEIEKRLGCDGHMHRRYRHKAGRLDRGLRNAVRRFQRKHKIYERTRLAKKTMKMIGMTPAQTNYSALVRVLQERLISATGILEDGSVQDKMPKSSTFVGSDGQARPVRNLVQEFTDTLLTQLSLETPKKAIEFFKSRGSDRFQSYKVGVKFPPLPEYYGPQMDLKLVVDRGTIWYEIPFTESGRTRYQRRKKMPRMTLYTRYKEQSIPLINWPTTIGGWREELGPDGYVYLKYKNSDVGDRVIRKIVAGPTWIPPKTEPLSALVKRRRVNGMTQNAVNYDAMGPGYLSAYGLVAGYFVIPGKNGRPDRDLMIRAHGSSNYMSILSESKYSHGCHRLMNHHAVRLYGFMLQHRHHTVDGDQPISFKRQFLYNEEVYRIHVPSRGFRYTMDPPVPVTVLRGQVYGKQRRRVEGLVKIPGKRYPSSADEIDEDEDRPDGQKKDGPSSTESGTPIKIGTPSKVAEIKKETAGKKDEKPTETPVPKNKPAKGPSEK